MQLPFTKMHGLGNDFMLLDLRDQDLVITPHQIQLWSDRHRGIGFDQLLILTKGSQPDQINYRIYNQDGSAAGQCGNGARCAAKFLLQQQPTLGSVTLNTEQISMLCQRAADGDIVVTMPPPIIVNPNYIFHHAGHALECVVIDLGNPHAVITVANVKDVDITPIAQQLQHDPYFPDSVNVGFVQARRPDLLDLRVYERGVGETLACGSGACAAAVAQLLQLPSIVPITINLLGGRLTVSWAGDNEPILMKGPATEVFSGTVTFTQ